jgi:hypothetical protein
MDPVFLYTLIAQQTQTFKYWQWLIMDSRSIFCDPISVILAVYLTS